MKNENDGYKGALISAVLGGAFFAVPYLALNASALLSLGIGVVAFGAGSLLFSDNTSTSMMVDEPEKQKSLNDIIKTAKEQNAQIYAIINKVDDKKLQNDIFSVHETAVKIIEAVSKHPEKLDKAQTFFNYYLPVTVKILYKYDDIENQRLNDRQTREFMAKTEAMVIKIDQSFKEQLASLYKSDMIDTDAEIKVFESMLKSDGLTQKNDFDIKK